MRVVLVEDEVPALERLEILVGRVAPEAEVVARLRTVRQTRAWLRDPGVADLIIADIQLGDGLSLDAFDDSELDIPIVFTTAFDHHLAPAMAANGIAYLLKPVREAELAAAIDKLRRLERHFTGGLAALARRLAATPTRIVGTRGRDWVGVSAEDVAWACVRGGGTYLVCHDGQELLIDDSLQGLHGRLGDARFFRANRWTLVSLEAVARVRRAGRGRLELVLEPPSDATVEIPQESSAAFRAWYGL